MSRSESEIKKRTPASLREQKKESYKKSIVNELNHKESKLSERDYQAYKGYWSYLKTASEKLYYLNLPREERQNYIDSLYIPEQKKIVEKRGQSVFASRTTVEEPELLLGMVKSDVVQLWGRPQIVEVAGNPVYENERWSYQRGHASHFVFFEQGRVQGWQLD